MSEILINGVSMSLYSYPGGKAQGKLLPHATAMLIAVTRGTVMVNQF